jgi:hypothetical protein
MCTVSIVLVLSGAAYTAGTKPEHFATLDGTTIRLEPFGASFQIPFDWTKDYQTVNITRAQLQKVRKGKGEWYREYARVVNAALPFALCSVQAGRYSWDSASSAGVQMRAYVFASNAEDIEGKIAAKGLAAAKALPTFTARNAAEKRYEEGRWHRVLISYDVWYIDYGGKANVEFYLTSREEKTVVLVFMYAGTDPHDDTSQIRQMLESFSWQ